MHSPPLPPAVPVTVSGKFLASVESHLLSLVDALGQEGEARGKRMQLTRLDLHIHQLPLELHPLVLLARLRLRLQEFLLRALPVFAPQQRVYEPQPVLALLCRLLRH